MLSDALQDTRTAVVGAIFLFSLLKQFSQQLICYAGGCFSLFQVHCFCLAVMIYEVVEERQEGEDTTGDCDDDEWEDKNVLKRIL